MVHMKLESWDAFDKQAIDVIRTPITDAKISLQSAQIIYDPKVISVETKNDKGRRMFTVDINQPNGSHARSQLLSKLGIPVKFFQKERHSDGMRQKMIDAALTDTEITKKNLRRMTTYEAIEMLKRFPQDSEIVDMILNGKAKSLLFRSVRDHAHHHNKLAMRLGYNTPLPWKNPNDVLDQDICEVYLIGTPEEIITKIEEYIKSGMKYLILMGSPTLDGLSLFSEKIIHAFK